MTAVTQQRHSRLAHSASITILIIGLLLPSVTPTIDSNYPAVYGTKRYHRRSPLPPLPRLSEDDAIAAADGEPMLDYLPYADSYGPAAPPPQMPPQQMPPIDREAEFYGLPTYTGEYNPKPYYYAHGPSYSYYDDGAGGQRVVNNPLDDLHEQMLRDRLAAAAQAAQADDGYDEVPTNGGSDPYANRAFFRNLMAYNSQQQQQQLELQQRQHQQQQQMRAAAAAAAAAMQPYETQAESYNPALMADYERAAAAYAVPRYEEGGYEAQMAAAEEGERRFYEAAAAQEADERRRAEFAVVGVPQAVAVDQEVQALQSLAKNGNRTKGGTRKNNGGGGARQKAGGDKAANKKQKANKVQNQQPKQQQRQQQEQQQPQRSGKKQQQQQRKQKQNQQQQQQRQADKQQQQQRQTEKQRRKEQRRLQREQRQRQQVALAAERAAAAEAEQAAADEQRQRYEQLAKHQAEERRQQAELEREQMMREQMWLEQQQQQQPPPQMKPQPIVVQKQQQQQQQVQAAREAPSPYEGTYYSDPEYDDTWSSWDRKRSAAMAYRPEYDEEIINDVGPNADDEVVDIDEILQEAIGAMYDSEQELIRPKATNHEVPTAPSTTVAPPSFTASPESSSSSSGSTTQTAPTVHRMTLTTGGGRSGQKEVMLPRPATPVRHPFAAPVMQMLAKNNAQVAPVATLPGRGEDGRRKTDADELETERSSDREVYDTIRQLMRMEQRLEKETSKVKREYVSNEETLVHELRNLKQAQPSA